MANLSGFLKACGEAERLVGRFYSELAEKFDAHPDVGNVLRKLADEENAHARTFEFLRSMASRFDENPPVASSLYQNLERLRRGLRMAMAMIPAVGNGTALKDAIGIAILVESATLERDKTAFVRVANKAFRNLLHALVAGDESHRRQLETLQASLAEGEHRGPAPARRPVNMDTERLSRIGNRHVAGHCGT